MRLLGKGICITACIALVTAAPALGQLRLTPSLGVSETFSDNVDQGPAGEEDAAFLTDVAPRVQLQWVAPRASATVDAATTFRQQTAGEDEGVEALPNLAGLANVEVSPDLFFVDASAAVSQELINTRESNTEANRETVQNYSVSPYLVSHLGGFANAELRYTLDQIFANGGDGESGSGQSVAGGDDISNATTHAVGLTLESGPDFTRLSWTFTGSASESHRSNDDVVERRDVNLGLEYVVTREISLLASAGYQKFDSGDSEDEVNSPTWQAGFRWRPGPRTDLRATYGERDDVKSVTANLSYQIGPGTALLAAYEEHLETGQERLSRDLSFIGSDPSSGALIDTRTGLPFDPNTAATTLTDATERTKTFRVAFRADRGRNTYELSGAVENSEEEGGLGNANDERAYRIDADWGRQMSPATRLDLFGSYERNEFEGQDRTDNEYGIGGNLSYSVYTNIDAFASYVFRKQSSDDESGEFTENSVTVGIRMTF